MLAARKRSAPKQEKGQTLIMFTLLLVVLLGFVAMVVDVGMFLHERQNVQNMVDAAALAGAQNLPDDSSGALAAAQQYAQLNESGGSPASVSVTFRCLVGDRDGNGQPDASDIPAVCDPGANAQWVTNNGLSVSMCVPAEGDTCNTIVVDGNKNVPFYFAPVLSVFGATGCFVSECPTGAIRAASCKGACGQAPNLPLDMVEIIDRTGSMSDSDLTNAKNGATSILRIFNPALQHVALGVLGPSRITTTCTGAYAGGLGIAASSGGTWLPVPLSSDFQNPDESLNASSLLVKTINCLNTSSVGTDLGDPMKAAADYLQANGRPNVKKGIVLLTDGAANEPTGTNGTGFLNASADLAAAGGDNNGYESNPTSAYIRDGASASDASSGTGTSTSCTNSGKDRHIFYDFNIPDLSASSIVGIQVQLVARVDSTSSSTRRMCVQLSWDGGLTWTAAKQTSNLSTSLETYTLGSGSDAWGHNWTASELSNTNLRVRVTDVANSTSRTFYLDWVAVNVFTPISGRGPCDYAAVKAAAAKALGIEIFTLGFGVEGETCSTETPSSPYYNQPVTMLLADMATDSLDDQGHCANSTAIANENADNDHFLCEARSGDLTPIFVRAGEVLAGGIRLIALPN